MEPLIYQIWGVGRNLLEVERDFNRLIEKVENNNISKMELLSELHMLKSKLFPPEKDLKKAPLNK